MTTFAQRRVFGATLAATFVLVVGTVTVAGGLALRRTELFTGWLLLIMLFALTLLNLRKKVPMLPVGSAAFWLQVHVYIGLASVGVFLLHTGLRFPSGGLERTVAALYTLVVVTGVFGLIVSRVLPPRLARRGEEVLFERIPALRQRLRDEAEALVLEAVRKTQSSTLASVYSDRLIRFFDGPRNVWFHLVESNRPRHRMLSEIDALARYLNDEERALAARLADLVRQKDDLDYQYAGQAVLKYWLFLHIPLTYSLLLFAVLHGLLAHAYSGDMW